jgi:hypothetical protein
MPNVGRSIQDLHPCNRPRPKEDPEAEVTELQEVQLRMASLATVEPIMEILREVVGSAATSCEPGKLRGAVAGLGISWIKMEKRIWLSHGECECILFDLFWGR